MSFWFVTNFDTQRKMDRNGKCLLDVNFKEKTDLRLNLPPLNGINGKVVVLFDPNDVEQVYRHEGKYPLR